MPRPSQSAKIGASTMRGSALTIFTYGSNTAASAGWRPNQKPMRMPATEPITKASTDSMSVIQRWMKIEPSENQRMIRRTTFSGVAKKNVGRIGSPRIGTAVRRCQSAIATTATRSWSERSLPRITIKLLPGLSASSVRLHEQADNAGRALGARRRAGGHDLGRDLVLGQAGRQVGHLEVGRDQHEGIMVRLHGGRRARAGIEADALGALAADVLVGLLAHLAFR